MDQTKKATNHWLMKSEPEAYSISDLERDGTTHWDGVRNYTARNLMRDEMKVSDQVLYYHSGGRNKATPGVAGIARVCKLAYPDHTQFDKKSKYFDPKATKDKPRWMMVDIEFVVRFAELLPLSTLREDPKLEGMPLLQRGQRLSVQRVSPAHFKHVVKLGKG